MKMLKYMILNMYEICKGLLVPRLAFFPTLYANAAPLLRFFAFKKPDWRDTFLPNSVYTAQSIITGLKWFQIKVILWHVWASSISVQCIGCMLWISLEFAKQESKQHGMFMSTRWYRAKSNRLIREPQRAHRDSAAPSWLWVLPLV